MVYGTLEMAQWLRVHAALLESQGLIPRTHMVVHNSIFRRSTDAIFWLPWAPGMKVCTCKQAKHTYTSTKSNKSFLIM